MRSFDQPFVRALDLHQRHTLLECQVAELNDLPDQITRTELLEQCQRSRSFPSDIGEPESAPQEPEFTGIYSTATRNWLPPLIA